jgi:WD40 repeat protein
MSFEMADNI